MQYTRTEYCPQIYILSIYNTSTILVGREDNLVNVLGLARNKFLCFRPA